MSPDSLVNTIKILSLPADDQLTFLKRLGCPGNIDELALQFHDQAVIASQLKEQGQITTWQLHIVIKVDELLTVMSGQSNAALWTEDALRQAKEWDNVRSQAAAFFDSPVE